MDPTSDFLPVEIRTFASELEDERDRFEVDRGRGV